MPGFLKKTQKTFRRDGQSGVGIVKLLELASSACTYIYVNMRRT